AFPTIGSTPIAELRHPEVKALLHPIWHTKKETARRVLQRVAEVVVWSIGEGLREHELPKSVIRKALGDQRMKVQHFDAVAVEDAPAVYEKLKALGSYAGEALRFQILTALRPGAARRARWEQVDLDLGLWTIPAAEMKSDEEHVVPLSKEALELLRDLPRVEGSPFLFPGSQPAKKALSDTG